MFTPDTGASPFAAAGGGPRVLLRSGWQVENIGDVAHTPGLLALLERHVPEARVVFWPWYRHLPEEEVAMIRRRFPAVRLVRGELDAEGRASTPELAAAMAEADFFLHGSGPATLGWAEALAFRREGGRDFGVFGVTYGLYGTPERAALDEAAFVFLRDSVSLGRLRDEAVNARVLDQAPDAAFACDVADDARAEAYLREHDLQPGRFLVCLPKHRVTPMWEHAHKNRPFDAEKHAYNERMAEHDHAPLREAITAVVRETGLKVLIGHEDITQIPIGKTWLLDRLPEDVRRQVVWRERPWWVDEARSIYARSAGLFGCEMHSPILCVGMGVPALVVRWAEQSSKGYMWRDFGMAEWLFDFDREEDVARLVPAVRALAADPAGARAKAEAARERVRRMQESAMATVRERVRAAAAARLVAT
jgi:polysaccharide pyruvyl transferase WcaK-like protein